MSVGRYRKLPVVVEAVQWTGENFAEITQWANDVWHRSGLALVIETIEGEMQAAPGWWIIKGVRGEFYPCHPDIFAATYEPVTELPKPWMWELRQGDTVLRRYCVYPQNGPPTEPTLMMYEMPTGELQWFLDRGDGFAPHGDVFTYERRLAGWR